MYIKAFSPSEHMEVMWSWLSARQLDLPDESSVPQIGYICFEDNTPVAMGFIRRVEGGFGQLDGLASNPKCSSESRNLAIDAVVEKLIIRSQEEGMKALISFSEDKNTLLRSIKHGFVQQDAKLIIRPTTKG